MPIEKSSFEPNQCSSLMSGDLRSDSIDERELYTEFNVYFLRDKNFTNFDKNNQKQIVYTTIVQLKEKNKNPIGKTVRKISSSVKKMFSNESLEKPTRNKVFFPKIIEMNKRFRESTITIWKKIIEQNEQIEESIDFQSIEKMPYERIFEIFNEWITDYKDSIKNTLDLSQAEIYFLPSELFLLTNLTELNLRGNSLREISKDIKTLEKLEILDVSFNKLKEIPSEVKELTNLKKISIYANKGLKKTNSCHGFDENVIIETINPSFLLSVNILFPSTSKDSPEK